MPLTQSDLLALQKMIGALLYIGKYMHYGDASYVFVPIFIKTCGRLGTTLVDLNWRLGCEVAECSDFHLSSSQFVARFLRELSVSRATSWTVPLQSIASLLVLAAG
jgi:hypothetical protein